MKFKFIKFICVFILIILNSCQSNIDEIFVDDRIERVFVEFVEEAKTSDYRDGDKIFIDAYSEESNKDWCMQLINAEFYNSDDNYGKFNYSGFKIYVNENVPQSIISLEDYNDKANFKFEGIPSKKSFLETYICFQQDSTMVKRLNFDNKEYLNTWKKLE